MSDENVHERWDARRERVENEMEGERRRIARDIAQGVKSLEVAVDALARIAELGGVQGDWALQALREVNGLMVARPSLRAMSGVQR